MTTLLFFQRCAEIAILLAILLSPIFPSQIKRLLVALLVSFLWIGIRMIDVAFFNGVPAQPLGYVVMPLLVFFWMFVVSLIWKVLLKIRHFFKNRSASR